MCERFGMLRVWLSCVHWGMHCGVCAWGHVGLMPFVDIWTNEGKRLWSLWKGWELRLCVMPMAHGNWLTFLNCSFPWPAGTSEYWRSDFDN